MEPDMDNIHHNRRRSSQALPRGHLYPDQCFAAPTVPTVRRAAKVSSSKRTDDAHRSRSHSRSRGPLAATAGTDTDVKRSYRRRSHHSSRASSDSSDASGHGHSGSSNSSSRRRSSSVQRRRSSNHRRQQYENSSDVNSIREKRKRHDGAGPVAEDEGSKLADLYTETKVEMLSLVETQLKCKLDLRSIKQHFLNLLKNFEAFEQRNPEWEMYAQQSPLKKKTSRRTRQRAAVNCRVFRTASPSNSADYSSAYMRHNSLSSSANQCPNNTAAGYGESLVCPWGAPLIGVNETAGTAELASVEYSTDNIPGVSLLSNHTINHVNLSNITKCSVSSAREQFSQSDISDMTGPLTSTMSYPQYSTPEKRKQSLLPEKINNNTLTKPRNSARRQLYDDERPTPTGMDSAKLHFIPSLGTPSRGTSATDSDATPIAVRFKRLSDRLSHPGSEDSGTHYADTPSTVTMDLSNHKSTDDHRRSSDASSSLGRVKPDNLKLDAISTSAFWDLDQGNKLRRQTAQPCLNDEELRSPVGLSETDLADPSASFFDQTNIQCSMDATRASMAQISSLSVSPLSSGSPPSSDVTISTCIDSSYKESDATSASSLPPAPKRHSAARQMSHFRHSAARSNTTSSMSALSQYTSASSYGGLVAPMNSPDITSNSVSPSGMPVINVTNSGAYSQVSPPAPVGDRHLLGVRPPCVGAEPCKPSAATRLHLSDPTPQATPYSGTSSDSLPGMSNRSSGSANSSREEPGKDNLSSGSDSGTTPGIVKSKVRRSLSKRIKSFGKHILRGQSKSKQDPHNSA